MSLDLAHPARRTVAAAEGVALLGFAAYVAVPDRLRLAAVVVMVAGALATLVTAVLWSRLRTASTALGVVVALSAAGLLGSVAYLHSIADEPAAIPLGGVGALLLSLVGLVVTAIVLATSRPPAMVHH